MVVFVGLLVTCRRRWSVDVVVVKSARFMEVRLVMELCFGYGDTVVRWVSTAKGLWL